LRLAIPSRWCAPGFGFLIGLALFALRTAELTADSLNEARAIATGGLPLHPHHLLFAPIVRALHLALSAVVPDCNALVVAQIHGALWTGISVASAYWILEHELGSRCAAALWTLALAVSSGYLTFATQVESYVPSAGCLLLLSALLLRTRGPWTAPAAIVLYAAAVLFHQSAVLFAVPLFFLVRRARGTSPASSWLGTYALVLAASGALVLTAYVLASGARSPGGVLDFALTYAHHPNPKFGSSSHLSPIGVFRLLRSQGRARVPRAPTERAGPRGTRTSRPTTASAISCWIQASASRATCAHCSASWTPWSGRRSRSSSGPVRGSWLRKGSRADDALVGLRRGTAPGARRASRRALRRVLRQGDEHVAARPSCR
jgi:hypothetical protein